MRSLLSSIVLAIVTFALVALAVWQFREGNLNRFLGTPPTPIGEKIYPNFRHQHAASITLRSGQTEAVFTKTRDGWQATKPWKDRMDSRAALAIISFVGSTTALDSVKRNEIKKSAAGLNAGNTQVEILDRFGGSLARFRLGRRTPLFELVPGENKPVPTTYLLPREREKKSYVYAATGDILPLFNHGFAFLRDHRPFALNPLLLERIRILTSQGELTLSRSHPRSPWRITKPLDLSADPAAVKTLLEGLYELQASEISDRSEVTLPINGTTPANNRIAIMHFGEDTETVLDIMPPTSPEARETLATVSDRPNSVFTLLSKPDPDLVSLADLPLTVNELRDATITNLNVGSIRTISIETTTSPTILVSREPPGRWIATIGGKAQPANEQSLFSLLKAVTETRALSFETDAAPEDLSPWGLDKPILTLTFHAENNQVIAVSFGLDRGGNLYAKRKERQTVMRLDNSILKNIAVRPYDWRNPRLWSISRVDLSTLIRTPGGQTDLTLNYDFVSERWKATREGENITASLDPDRANFLLATLENLKVSRWLSPSDEEATKALESPSLTFSVTENVIDEFGEKRGERTQILTLAVDTTSKTIFGKVSSDPSHFILAPEDFLKLSMKVLDD